MSQAEKSEKSKSETSRALGQFGAATLDDSPPRPHVSEESTYTPLNYRSGVNSMNKHSTFVATPPAAELADGQSLGGRRSVTVCYNLVPF